MLLEIELCRTNSVKPISSTGSKIAFTKNTIEDLILVANGIRWYESDNIIITEVGLPANTYPFWNPKEFGVETRMGSSYQRTRQH